MQAEIYFESGGTFSPFKEVSTPNLTHGFLEAPNLYWKHTTMSRESGKYFLVFQGSIGGHILGE